MICLICGKECKDVRHIISSHSISAKTYYDKFFKKLNEGICPICGRETRFKRFSTGYCKACCNSHAQLLK